MRMIIEFNLSTIPSDSVVHSASLSIYQEQSAPANDVNMGLQSQYMKTQWQENLVTWNNANYLGGDIIGLGDNTAALGWKTIDVANVVREWISGARTNYGFIVTGDESPGPNRSRTFASRERAGLEPRMTITFDQSCDSVAPTAWVVTLPAFSADEFNVSWTGTDSAPENCTPVGIAYYDVQYNINSGSWFNWQTNNTGKSATFKDAQNGQTYGFRARAADNAGNVQGWTDAQASTFVINSQPELRLEVRANGLEVGETMGPVLEAGETVTWTFHTRNVGNSQISNIEIIIDDPGIVHDCGSMRSLLIGESSNCVGLGIIQDGPQKVNAIITGKSEGGEEVAAQSKSYYFGAVPNIQLMKFVNGKVADTPPGPILRMGDITTWNFVITNSGNITLSNIVVLDDQFGQIECPTEIYPSSMIMCSLSVQVALGQHQNTAEVSGMWMEGEAVEDQIKSYYFGATPSAQLKKFVNEEDADTAPGPLLRMGEIVMWKFVITNSGNITLTNVVISDDQFGQIDCPSEIVPSSTVTCSFSRAVTQGQHRNTAKFSGMWKAGELIQSADSSHYFGEKNQLYIPNVSGG